MDAELANAAAKIEEYTPTISSVLVSKNAIEDRIVDHLVSDDVPLVVSRERLEAEAQEIAQEEIALYALTQIQPKVVSFQSKVYESNKKIDAVVEHVNISQKLEFTIGTICVATFDKNFGLVFATDSKAGHMCNNKLITKHDNMRKFYVAKPYVLMFSGSFQTLGPIISTISTKMAATGGNLTFDEFKNEVVAAMQNGKCNNSFIIGSCRRTDGAFSETYLWKIPSDGDPEQCASASIGSGVRGLDKNFEDAIPREKGLVEIENYFIKALEGVVHLETTCGGPIEMLSVTNEGGNFKENHRLDILETLCDKRKISYRIWHKNKEYLVSLGNHIEGSTIPLENHIEGSIPLHLIEGSIPLQRYHGLRDNLLKKRIVFGEDGTQSEIDLNPEEVYIL